MPKPERHIYDRYVINAKGKETILPDENWNGRKTFSYENETWTVEKVVKKTYSLDGTTEETIYERGETNK